MGDTVELRSPIGLMQLFDDGVIVHTIDEGAVVDLRNVAFADKGSRSMFASDPAGGVEVATALVASARVSQFLAGLFVREQPGRPTSVFEDPTAAKAWAAEQLRLHHERGTGTTPGTDRPSE